MGYIKTIMAQEFTDRLKTEGLGEGEILLDVRSAFEVETISPDCESLHVPLHEIDANEIRPRIEGKTVYVLCKAGVRAMKAAELLHEAGKYNLIVIEGGLNSCCQARIPLKGEEISPSAETQERLQKEAQNSVRLFMGRYS